MKLLVLGASGGVGRHVVEHARARGHAIRVVVRPATTVDLSPATEILRGDVLQQDTIDAAMKGCDAVLMCLGIRRRIPLFPWSKLLSPRDFTQRAIGVALRAMQRHGVQRIVAISAAGVRETWTSTNMTMQLLIRWSNIGIAYEDLGVMEGLLETSALDWMAVRPVTLIDTSRTQRAVVVPRYGLTSTISRSCVANFLLDKVEQSEPFRHRTPMIAGTGSPAQLRR